MATAETVKDLTKLPELEISKGQTVLVLDKAEAEVLLGITGQCASGGITAPIYYALANSGVTCSKYKVMNGSKYSGFNYAGTLTIQPRNE